MTSRGALDDRVDGQRSPSERTCQLRARSSGIWRRRPKSVVT
jgi:hypothetical protein